MEYYSSLDASQLDSETPTLFELISAKQLEALLSPSLRYILVHYATKYPQYLLKVANRFDELNFLLRTFVEWYFFKYWQGSFTENFYGIKRVTQTPLSDSKFNQSKLVQIVPSSIEERRSLTPFQKAVSILEITGTAYLSEKCNYMYELWYPKYITNQLNADSKKKHEVIKVQLKRKFVEWWPTIQSILRAGNFLTTLLYLSGASKSPSIVTFIARINYSRLSQYDYSKNEPEQLNSSKNSPNKVRPSSMNEYIFKLFANNITKPSWKAIKFILGTFFPAAIFTLKFLEWWNNSDFASQLSKNLGNELESVLPPPSSLSKFLEVGKRKNRIYRSKSTCPLCNQEINNPAIIETGYVFCYSCIFNYLRNSHKIVGQKVKNDNCSDSDSDDNERGKEDDDSIRPPQIDINKGGRCPITGKKLLGCKWNSLKEEFDVQGLRRLIF